MNIYEKFLHQRKISLHAPASIDDVALLEKKLSGNGKELIQMYSYFDGEKTFESDSYLPCALLCGMRFNSIKDLIGTQDDIVDVWDVMEDNIGCDSGAYPLRFFFPFISSTMGRDIGVIYSDKLKFNGCVIEYDYENGEFRVLSKSLKNFIDAFFNFSIDQYLPVNNFVVNESEFIFSESDKMYLSQWSDVVYPVIDDGFQDAGLLMDHEN